MPSWRKGRFQQLRKQVVQEAAEEITFLEESRSLRYWVRWSGMAHTPPTKALRSAIRRCTPSWMASGLQSHAEVLLPEVSEGSGGLPQECNPGGYQAGVWRIDGGVLLAGQAPAAGMYCSRRCNAMPNPTHMITVITAMNMSCCYVGQCAVHMLFCSPLLCGCQE